MTDRFFAQKGTTHIIVIFVVILVAIGGIVWFFSSKKDSRVSPEDLMVSFKPRSFQDVLPDDKNFAAVEYLFREGILERDESKIFNPGKVVSRAEWVDMLVRLTGITPAEDIYKNCFSDVGKGRNEAAICFAKEQGWLKGFSGTAGLQTFNIWQFIRRKALLIPEVFAQQKEERFNPDVPVKDIEAIGSLSRLMKWDKEQGQNGNSNEQAAHFAKERKIYETKDSATNLTKENATGIIYRSVATVPLGNDKFSKDAEHQVERYKIEGLIDLDDKLEQQRAEERKRNRKERQKKMAKIIGEEAAAEIMAITKDGSDEEYTAYIRKVREKKYEKMLAEEKASGRQPPTFNILEPLQKTFADKGVIISQDDLLILKKRPPHYEIEEKMSDPVINSRESARITLVLDKNYAVLSRSNWAKAKYMVPITLTTFYQERRSIIFAGLILVDLETGVSERAYRTRYYGPSDLVNLFKEGVSGLEVEIGQAITQPSITTPSPVQSPNDYSDGYFEFLDVATGQPSIAFSTAQKPHIIVAADSGVDVRNWLPIRIEIKKDGSKFWSGRIEGDPSQVCRDPSGCSTNGPSGIGIDWKKIEITAYDKNGKVVATFGETYNSR